MLSSSSRLLLGSLLSAAAVSAQGSPLPDWSSLPFANVTSYFAEATIVVAQEPATIHAYSSFTRSWTHLPVSSTATYKGYDDHVIVQDGPMFFGWSSRYPKFQPIGAPTGTLVAAPAQSWASVVVDGSTAYYYSALLGSWTTIQFSVTPFVSVSRLAAVLTDATTTVALSAHFAKPVPITTTGSAVTVGSVGLCGYAVDAQSVHCFSAYRNAWLSVPASSAANVVKPPNRASFLAILDGSQTTFYSAVTGTTSVVPSAPGTVLQTQDDTAVVSDPITGLSYAYAGIAGTAVLKALPPPVTVTVKRYFATLQSGNLLETFSSPRGRFAAPMNGAYTVISDVAAAIVTDSAGAPTHAYSPLTNSWSAVPAAVANAQYFVTWCAAFVVAPSGGILGFSAQTGSWAFVPSPPPSATYKAGAMFVAQSGTRLDTFNPRLAVWRTIETDAPVTQVTCFDQALLASVGDTVYGYCLYSDHWVSRRLASTIVGTQVRDELCIAYDAATLHVFGASDQLSNIAVFPYYWRVLTHGGPLDYHLAGLPGSTAAILLNVRPASLRLPPFGTLNVDPIGALVLPLLPLPAEGITRVALTLPDDPSLAGTTLYAQALVVQGPSAYLTNVNLVTIF